MRTFILLSGTQLSFTSDAKSPKHSQNLLLKQTQLHLRHDPKTHFNIPQLFVPSGNPCTAVGQYYADTSTGCTNFWQCTGPGQGGYKQCVSGTAFNAACNCCDYPSNFVCGGATPTPSTGSPTPTPASTTTPAPSATPGTTPPATPTPTGEIQRTDVRKARVSTGLRIEGNEMVVDRKDKQRGTWTAETTKITVKQGNEFSRETAWSIPQDGVLTSQLYKRWPETCRPRKSEFLARGFSVPL